MPYRRTKDADRRPDELTAGARWDDLALGLLMVALAAPRVVLAFAHHETFGAETTIAAVFTALGVLLLATAHRVRRG